MSFKFIKQIEREEGLTNDGFASSIRGKQMLVKHFL